MTKRRNEHVETEVDVSWPSIMSGCAGGIWVKKIKRVRHWDQVGLFGYIKHKTSVLCEFKLRDGHISFGSDKQKIIEKALERAFKY